MIDKIREAWENAIRFLRETRTELKKVSWPQRREIIGSTVVVIVSVFLVSFFLGLVDLTLQRVLSVILPK